VIYHIRGGGNWEKGDMVRGERKGWEV